MLPKNRPAPRQEHQMTLLKCHEELRQHHQNEKNILQDLQDDPIAQFPWVRVMLFLLLLLLSVEFRGWFGSWLWIPTWFASWQFCAKAKSEWQVVSVLRIRRIPKEKCVMFFLKNADVCSQSKPVLNEGLSNLSLVR